VSRLVRFTAALAAAGALACGPADPEPHARVVAAGPSGAGVPTAAQAELRFSAPVDGEGLLDGRRVVLVEAGALRAAMTEVESEAGASGVGVATRASLEEGGRCVVLRPAAPLRAFSGYALVLSSRARAADGRPILDPEGRRRTFVATFETGAGDGPPPAPALTEVRADAETPESGGEYVEVANLGAAPLDLAGFRLAKRSATGALSSCAIAPAAGGAVLAPGAVAIVAGGAWDGRYPLPAGIAVHACGAAALLGGIANDRAPRLLLADPAGTVLATLGEGGAPECAAALEKIDPAGDDAPENLACTEGSPGWLR
jgi:hypothetical protein